MIRPSLTKEELFYLQNILHHFTDYIGYDDRPDHGLGVLKQYRDLPDDKKRLLYRLAGKMMRLYRKNA